MNLMRMDRTAVRWSAPGSVYYAFKDYERVVEENCCNPLRIKDALLNIKDLLFTFRFIRNYSKGVEDSWTINALNKLYEL